MMKKKILFSLYDMEVGGVERSFISMTQKLDYKHYQADLILCRQQGEFLDMLPVELNLLDEIAAYTTFRKSIRQVFKEKHYMIGLSRLLSKANAYWVASIKKMLEPGYYQMQLMWKYALPFLPKLEKEYDVAISYLWPHYLIADKVQAKKKIAWIHTDYSNVETNISADLKMWNKFDDIIAVSEACKASFLKKYSELDHKVMVLENITSPEWIRSMVNEGEEDNPMLTDRRFKLVTVARLSHAKGIDQAIRALCLLKDRGYGHIAWYVVGYGGDEAMLRSLIAKHDLQESFILLGKKTNPYPYIQACDVYVQPSRYEGKAVTVTEAQIIGKPILITNYSTASSQVIDGLDGIICDLSIAGIASGIERLYRDNKLRNTLMSNIKGKDYSNGYELDKLYQIIV